MTSSDDYKNGIDYEMFMQRAYKTNEVSRPGMHASVMQNLINIENGDKTFVKFHGSYEKQFEKIKIYMNKAMDKYLKMRKIPSDSINRLNILKNHINRAYSSNCLMKIINETMEITQCVKEH